MVLIHILCYITQREAERKVSDVVFYLWLCDSCGF